MSEHTPSTPDVEMRYIRFRQLEADIGADGVTPHRPGEFKRWYEAEVRKAKAEALRDAADEALEHAASCPDKCRSSLCAEHNRTTATWLRRRADQIERAAR